MTADPASALRRRAEAALGGTYAPGTVAQGRLADELALVEAAGTAPCWLALAETARILYRRDVMARRAPAGSGPGWGPSAASLLAYLFELTGVDPIQHGLVVEHWYAVELAAGRPQTLVLDVAPERRGPFAAQLARTWAGLGGQAIVAAEGAPESPHAVVLPRPSQPGGAFTVRFTGRLLPRSVQAGAFFTLQRASADSHPDAAFRATFGDGPTLGERVLEVFATVGAGTVPPWAQFAEPEAAGIVRAMRPASLTDLAILVALFRPLAMAAGLLDRVVAARHGRRSEVCPHPVVESSLADTYGMLVFAEQGIRILAEIGGLQPMEAALLWRDMGTPEPVRRPLPVERRLRPGTAKRSPLGPTGFVACARDRGFLGDAAGLYDWLADRKPLTFCRAHCVAQALWVFALAAQLPGRPDRAPTWRRAPPRSDFR